MKDLEYYLESAEHQKLALNESPTALCFGVKTPKSMAESHAKAIMRYLAFNDDFSRFECFDFYLVCDYYDYGSLPSILGQTRKQALDALIDSAFNVKKLAYRRHIATWKRFFKDGRGSARHLQDVNEFIHQCGNNKGLSDSYDFMVQFGVIIQPELGLSGNLITLQDTKLNLENVKLAELKRKLFKILLGGEL